MVSQADIRRKLEELSDRLPSPDALASWDVETGLDATGDPAVWVWAIIRDDHVDRVWRTSFRDEVREHLRRAIRDLADDDLQVYVRFRLQSENQELHREGRAT